MGQMNSDKWVDDSFVGLIGTEEIKVLSMYTEPQDDNAKILLFSYKDQTSIFALRWSIGAVMELGTDDLDVAKGSINAMIQMEASDG